MNKKILNISMLGLLFTLVGCSGNSSVSSNSAKESSAKASETITSSTTEVDDKSSLRMESELTDLTGVVGSGISGSQSGVNMIQKNAGASGGYYVGFTHRSGFALTYNFTAEKAGKATIALGLGNELGVGLAFDSDSLTVHLNDTKLSYTGFTVRVDGYKAYTLGNYDLVAGNNKIVVTVVGPNEYCNGATGGPEFDYVDLTTTDNSLSWNPKLTNLPEEE